MKYQIIWPFYDRVSKICEAKGSTVNSDVMTNLNRMQHLYGKMFRPQVKFQIMWITIKITQFDLWKLAKQW